MRFRFPRRRGLRPASTLLALGLIAIVFVGCGDDEGTPGAERLADRILRLGEEPGTQVDVLAGALPAGLQEALNPGATADTPAEELTAVPVHPEGELLGSFRLERNDGVLTFFLFYDVSGNGIDVEAAVAQQVDESPWQAIGGQSGESISTVNFQSTISGEVTGTAAIREVPASEGATALTSVVYILEVQPAAPVEQEAFALPSPRPLPDGFPLTLALDGTTPINVQWADSPAGTQYQLMLLTEESSSDVTERYRQLLEGDGWQLASDQAQGFATLLEFEKDEGASRASVSIDAFSEDESLTAVFLSLQLAR